jgi:hypothetical protein
MVTYVGKYAIFDNAVFRQKGNNNMATMRVVFGVRFDSNKQ